MKFKAGVQGLSKAMGEPDPQTRIARTTNRGPRLSGPRLSGLAARMGRHPAARLPAIRQPRIAPSLSTRR